jgi:ubiquinone/menaquinone biosynthesis C-methylase UbiE
MKNKKTEFSRKYTYYDGNKDKEHIVTEFKKPLKQKYEMDKNLEKIISPYIKTKNYQILDACCGIGQISNYLYEINNNLKITGIDQTSFLIKEAKKLWNNTNLNFKVKDIYEFAEENEKKFDITINWKTLSWLPYYDEMIKSLIKLTKKHIFLSSLFYDGDIDFETKVREYQTEVGKNKFNHYFNVYSLPRFQDFVLNLGVKNIEVFDFNIDVDIPKPPIDQIGTYTEKLDDGRRLQISGNIIQSWKIIRIDL